MTVLDVLNKGFNLTFPLEQHMCQHFVNQKLFFIILQLKFENAFLSYQFLPVYTL